MIESAAVTDIHPRRAGLRVRLEYTFTGGRAITIGPISVPDIAAAQAQLTSRQQQALEKQQEWDAEEAVALGSTTAHLESSVEQVYRAWLFKGFEEPESRIAYKIMQRVADKVIALGLTAAQVAVRLEIEPDDMTAILSRWSYLKSNKAVIDAYELVKQGDV